MNQYLENHFAKVFTAILFAWIAGLFVPLIASSFHLSPAFQVVSKLLYKSVCLQLPERTLSINNSPFPVCARCLGIYCGFGIVLIFGIIKKFKMMTLFVIFAVCFPMLIDVGRLILHISTYSKAAACFTGGLFGIASSNLYLQFYYSQFRKLNEK